MDDLDGLKMERKVYVGHKVHGIVQMATFGILLLVFLTATLILGVKVWGMR